MSDIAFRKLIWKKLFKIADKGFPDRFNKVFNEIYRGGEPSAQDLEILANVFKIKKVISLDGEIGNKISPIVKQLGMKHIIIPITGEASKNNISYLKNNINNLIQEPVYIHCRHGSDRTGMAVAFIRLNNGWSVDQALSEAKSYGFGDKLNSETEDFYISQIMGDSNAVHDDFESGYDGLVANYSEKIPFDQSGDIVADMRDVFNLGDVPPAFNTQQSFAPHEDIKRWGPGEEIRDPNPFAKDPFMSGFYSHKDTSDRKFRIEELKNLSEGIPQVGQYDNGAGIKGVGPVETGNILL